MPQQKVPDMDFGEFVLSEIKQLFGEGKIFINEAYQRGDVWKHSQKTELIKSIEKRYTVGILVLYVNEAGHYEILDGQQRLLTIKKYLNDELDLAGSSIAKYSELDLKSKTLLDAYCLYYLKLKSHDAENKEEDIVQTFLRLQEGTPLNKAEKINAYRGKFKDVFKKVSGDHPLFKLLGPEKRFRWRQLAAEMLLIELEGDFKKMVFPSLDSPTLIRAVKMYAESISEKKVRFFIGNLDFIHRSLNILLTAFSPREVISFYLLVSYLRRLRAGNENLETELALFGREFQKNLNSFSMYDPNPPKGMNKKRFELYKKYKQESKMLTTPESLENRLQIILGEFKRVHPIILRDEKRLHDEGQRRTLYLRQKGLCPECKKEMCFKEGSAHHIFKHSSGGKTDDLRNAVLLHQKCHERIENVIKKH